MARATKPRVPKPPAPDDVRVPVVIVAGHTHRGVFYEMDTRYLATPDEAELLQRFGALRGDG